MQDEPKPIKHPKFASPEDFNAWHNDFIAFGTAIVDSDGRHVPLAEERAKLNGKQD